VGQRDNYIHYGIGYSGGRRVKDWVATEENKIWVARSEMQIIILSIKCIIASS